VETKVQKWGNSLGVRIPRSVASGLRLGPGTPVDVSASDDAILIRPLERPKLKLAEMLERVKPSNLHGAVDTGAPVGREDL
jgi:antitoxin MazE